MTSIFYPLLISMLPPPPTLFLPPLPLPLPLPPAIRSFVRSLVRSFVRSFGHLHLPAFFHPAASLFHTCTATLFVLPLLFSPSTFYATTLGPSVLRENVHVHRAHSRRNNHFFVPDNTCAASPRRVNSLPRRLPFVVVPPPSLSTSLSLFPFFLSRFLALSPSIGSSLSVFPSLAFFLSFFLFSFFFFSLPPSLVAHPSSPPPPDSDPRRNRTDVDAAVFHLSVPRGNNDIFFGSKL